MTPRFYFPAPIVNAMDNSTRSCFIVLDGPDGCGKSTQARLLADSLAATGADVLLTREPGGTPAGGRIRQVLLDPETGYLDPLAEAFLFCADRAQHVRTLIAPALAEGKIVICDRFASATVVYQGYAGGLGVELAQRLSDIATDGLQPDLLVVLDVDAETAALRLDFGRLDRIESNDGEFHRRVREGFIEYARNCGDRAVVIDGSGSREQVHRAIARAVEGVVGR